jgi:hypothetical protein
VASKSVTPPFQVIGSLSVSGTNAYVSSVTNILYRDSISLQYHWTGNPQGSIDVQGSVNYSPGIPQAAGVKETANAGTWTSITLSPSATVSGSSSILINMNQLAFPFIRTVYTNSSGSGILSAWVSGKSLGV